MSIVIFVRFAGRFIDCYVLDNIIIWSLAGK